MLNYSKMTDYELFLKIKKGGPSAAKHATHELWDRYDKAVCKGFWTFNNFVKENKFHIETDIDNYKVEAYEAFIKAVDSVKLEKIPAAKVKTWKFWICLNGYLRAFNRDEINHFTKRTKNETALFVDNSDGEEFCVADRATEDASEAYEREAISRVIRNAISNSYTKFTALQKKIWDGKVDEMPKSKICKACNITGTVLNKNFEVMKGILKKEILDGEKTEYIDTGLFTKSESTLKLI